MRGELFIGYPLGGLAGHYSEYRKAPTADSSKLPSAIRKAPALTNNGTGNLTVRCRFMMT
jgi:hypothetical protein